MRLFRRDIFTALTNGAVCQAVKKLFVGHIRAKCPDVEVIVGLESRGFLFSLMIAAELGCGCAPIRKKGKLPGDCIQLEYQLEYGVDVMEMQTDSIRPGQKVIVVDDLLATGGTLEAAVKLIRKMNGDLVECVVLLELDGLNGRSKAAADVHSFIQY